MRALSSVAVEWLHERLWCGGQIYGEKNIPPAPGAALSRDDFMNRSHRVFLIVLPLLFVCVISPARSEQPTAKAAFFKEKVTPILQRSVGCHSGDTPAGGLTLSTRELALKGGESG